MHSLHNRLSIPTVIELTRGLQETPITEDYYTMEHAFNTNIAAQYDVNIAILLHNFKFWTFNNLANKRNIYDGLCWSYDTLEALGETFPYWSRRQLERVINN